MFYESHHFTFQLNSQEVLFTLSELLDKPWSKVSSLPPGTRLHFHRKYVGFGVPTFQLLMLINFHRLLPKSRSLDFRYVIDFLRDKKFLY